VANAPTWLRAVLARPGALEPQVVSACVATCFAHRARRPGKGTVEPSSSSMIAVSPSSHAALVPGDACIAPCTASRLVHSPTRVRGPARVQHLAHGPTRVWCPSHVQREPQSMGRFAGAVCACTSPSQGCCLGPRQRSPQSLALRMLSWPPAHALMAARAC